MTKSLQFLSGGGEMGALINNHSWESSPLGPADKWPQSLRTTLSILVNSKFPMFLYWGPQLLCFYNDAYRFSLGNDGRHPAILGMRGEEAWPETWHLIKPSIDQVINKGEATWSEDQLIPIYRDGEMKDAYWTFSFSPVKDESNQTAGVFLTLIETTDKVNNLKKLIETNDRLAFAIEATELGTFDLNPVTNKFIANNRLKDWFGLPHELEADLPLAIQQIAEQDQARVAAAIQQTLQYESGGLYDIEYSILNPVTKQERFVRAKGRARFGEDKTAQRFTGTIQDVTKQAIDKKIIEANEKRTEIERKTLHNFFYQAPAMLAILKGPQHIFEFANPPYLELIGNRNPIGKTVLEALPEVAEQGFIELLDKVYHTGETFTGREVSIDLDKGSGQLQQFYLNFSYQAFANEKGEAEGILVFAYDVTEQVVARKLMEASEKRFSNILEQSIMAIQIFKGREMRIAFMNEPMIVLYGKGRDVIGKTLLEVLPEMKDHPFPKLLDDVYTTGVPYYGYEMPGTIVRNGNAVETYFNFVYQPYREVDNSITGITVIGNDVGPQVHNKKRIEESENQFRTFADSIQNLAWIANGDGWIYWYNQRWYDYTGTTLNEMEGSGWEKVHHPDKIQKVHEFLKEAWKKDKPFELTCELRREDGKFRWFLTRAYPVKDIYGKIERWIGTNTDITDQKSFTEELEQQVKERTYQINIQNENFKHAEESSMQGSYTFNLTTGKLSYSDNLYRLIGYLPNEFEPSLKDFNKYVHPDDRNYLKATAEKVLQTKTSDEWHYRIISKTGAVINIKGTGRVIESGHEELFVGTLQDVTKDVAAAEELKKNNLALELTNAELKSFSYITSHDLKEPLRKIQAFSKRIIKIENFSDQTQNYFNRIISAAERMQNLIDSLLDFSSANNSDMTFKSCDLNAIVEESKNDLQERISEKQAIITSQNLPAINGIHIQLSQLITNLLDNAIKYSRPEIQPYIEITALLIHGNEIEHPAADNQKTYNAIKITDNGIGFENEYSNKIFELFQRLHGHHEYSGTGIGLAIVKKIVTNHNGFIIAEGKPDKGSTFTIYIPTT